MKTIVTLSVLAGSILCGADSSDAQCYTRPAYITTRPVITRPVVTQPVSTPVVTYGNFSHIDDLAVEMEQLSRDILWEMHFNYSRNPGFDITYAEAYDILNYSKYIHAQEHRGNRAEIARVVGELDRLFHHVEDDIRNWRPRHTRLVARGSLYAKMEQMEDTLHHLMQDVGITAQATDPPPPGFNNDPPQPLVTLSQF